MAAIAGVHTGFAGLGEPFGIASTRLALAWSSALARFETLLRWPKPSQRDSGWITGVSTFRLRFRASEIPKRNAQDISLSRCARECNSASVADKRKPKSSCD